MEVTDFIVFLGKGGEDGDGDNSDGWFRKELEPGMEWEEGPTRLRQIRFVNQDEFGT